MLLASKVVQTRSMSHFLFNGLLISMACFKCEVGDKVALVALEDTNWFELVADVLALGGNATLVTLADADCFKLAAEVFGILKDWSLGVVFEDAGVSVSFSKK